MPDQKISAMTPAGALTGAEIVPVVQGGANVRTSIADMASYGNNLVSLSSLGASANGITLIGHTFAQMRADLDLEIGVDVQAYDADTAKTDVAQSWTANQTFGGSDANVLTIYRSGAAAKLRFIESTNSNAWGIRNNANTLTFDYNSTDRLTLDGSGNLTLGAGLTTAGRNRLHGGPFLMPAAGAHDNATQIGNTDPDYGLLIGSLGSGNGFLQAQRVDGTATTYNLSLQPNGGSVITGGAITAGGPINLKSYTVAGLPAGTTGDVAYASNGRKNGEGAASGTGVMVFKDGTAWCACDTGATVAA